jgi:hypothetical protein
MDSLFDVKVLLGVLIGLIPSLLARYLSKREERRAAIGRALADLLEIRKHILGTEILIKEIRKIAPPEILAQEHFFRGLVDQIAPAHNELHERYDAAVTTLAGLDPILGYQLRSKDVIRPGLQHINAIMKAAPGVTPVLEPITRKAVDMIDVELKKAIRSLAWKHGVVTRLRVSKSLKRQEETPQELQEIFNSVPTSFKAAAAGLGHTKEPS